MIPDKANYLAGTEATSVSGLASISATKLVPTSDQQRLIAGGDDPFLPHLILHMDQADTCDIAVAFLLDSGARLIVDHLRDFLARGGDARILLGDYLDVTDPVALRRLADLEGNLTLRVHQSADDRGFHLKSYIFQTGEGGVAFVGSSNLSESALTTSIEWNYKVVSSCEVRGFDEVRRAFETLFHSHATTAVTDAWIEGYERRRVVAVARAGATDDVPVPPEPPLPIPSPHEIQQRALIALEQTREDGFTAGLVVLATGLGKTWLAAFDSDRADFPRILFVAHREEILSQAIDIFRRVRPTARIGRLAADIRDTDADLVFASIQTLSRVKHLSQFASDDFDYIIVDEFHHAAASTYRRVIDTFRPKFLLGLTATPERTDGADLLGCGDNLTAWDSPREANQIQG